MILLPLFFLAYIAAWIVLVIGAGVISWRFSKSKKVTGFAVALAFLVMYWPAFGDLIPALLAHKHYCETEAGFKIYTTPEQWATENPGVLETLVPYKKFTAQNSIELGNERVGMKFDINIMENVAIRKEVETIIDIKTKKILSENIDFSRGYGSFASQDERSIKFWLYLNSCYSDQNLRDNVKQRKEFLKQFKTSWGN